MKRFVFLLAAMSLLGVANVAWAWHLDGHVYCDATGLPLTGQSIQVTSTDGGGFTGTGTSDDTGFFLINLPDGPGCYMAMAILGGSDSAIQPPGNSFTFCTDDVNFAFTQNFVISSASCNNEGCWLTGGGAKFSQITGTFLGQSNTVKQSKMFNWGGNVNPGCSPTAGQGGQWNTIDALNKLHFQGDAIQVVRCGNVDGIPPGSTSPVTPFNFIEFKGTGRVKGIQGNKADYPLVYFFARAEDRNEPGSNGQRDGAGKDRYFLNVYTDLGDPFGTSIMLVDMDGDPGTVDPLIITDGNMQIHVSSCTGPLLAQATQSSTTSHAVHIGPETPTFAAQGTQLAFAAVSPNPVVERAILRYSLPTEANVSLAVYDVAGRMVRQVERGIASPGQHSTSWDLRDGGGQRVAGGIYFLRLAVNDRVFTQHISIVQ